MVESVLRHRRATRNGRMAVAAGAVALALGGGTVGYLQFSGDEAACTGGLVELNVVASPDQYPALNELADQWSDAGPEVDGRCVSAAVRAMASNRVAASIGPGWDDARDGPRPDVWTPDFSAWLSLAAARPEAADVLPRDESPSLATSPTVIAMQRPMAEALGWPSRALGWSDLIGAFRDGKTWADHGHREWGPMRLGMADPTRSGAGLAAAMTIMDPDNDQRQSNEELYAALSASQLTAVTAEDPSALLGRYAGAVGDDTSTLPAAIPVLERELAEYAEDSPRVPLVPIYPKEGAAYADYPFAVLRAPWVDDVRRKAAADLLAHLLKPASRRTYEAAGFRDAEHVSRDRVRLDPERGFQGAVAAPERTTTAQALTQMLGVWGVLQRSNNALLLLDVSGSMNDPVPGTSQTRLQLVQRAAIAGAGLLNNGTTVGLWAFATDLTPTSDFRELVAPGPAGGTVGGVPRHQAVASAVRGLRAAGGTGLYDTIGAAYDRMQRAWKPNARNMLVVMTDGKNEDESGLSLEQLLAKLKASARPDRPVTILAIAVGPKADATALEQITKVTGGRTFVERNDVSAIQQITLAFAGRVS